MDVWYPAQPSQIGEIRRAVAAVARTIGAGDDVLMQINLAVSEAVTNAILHAYRDHDRGVRVVVSTDDEGCLDVSVRDRGVGPGPRPDSPGLGLGLGLMAHETEGFAIRKMPDGGTEVVLRFRL